MKVIKGKYKKPDGNGRQVELLIFNKDTDYICGIDLSLLSEKDRNKVLNIQFECEKQMNKYMSKAFRNFRCDRFLDMQPQEIKPTKIDHLKGEVDFIGT